MMGNSEDYQESEWDSHIAFSQQYHQLRWKLTQTQMSDDLESWYKMIRVLKKHVFSILSEKERIEITDKLNGVDKMFGAFNRIPETNPSKAKGHWIIFKELEQTEELINDKVNKHVPLIKLKEKLDWSSV